MPVETVTDFIFLGCKITTDSDCTHKIKRHLVLEEKLYRHKQHIEKQRHHFDSKGPYSQCYGFSSSYIWTWELNHKEDWEPKNWCFRIVVLEKTLESPLDCKEINPVNPKGNQPWIFIGRTDAEDPILWPPDGKSQLTRKDSGAGKDWRQEKGMRAWDASMASLTQRTWIWANSGRQWKTKKPGVPQSKESQGVRDDLVSEQQQQKSKHCEL